MDSQEFPQNEASQNELPDVNSADDITQDIIQESSASEGAQQDQIDWEKRFKDTQSSYTKLQQKIQSIENAFAPQVNDQQLDPEKEEAAKTLKEMGFADMDSVQNVVKSSLRDIERETGIREVLASNPELSNYSKVIRRLSELDPDKSVEEIVIENNFLEREKLNAANSQSDVTGYSVPQKEERPSITEMDDDTYAAFIKGNTKNKFTRRIG